ncbi:hypothetical protein KC19_2G287300 [Ceratodon purpureus]|uniref:DNA mismatch repair protein MSH3 n=1 Tax=Ceratodon purpureus TaxID=3225 RepID=A0A8T0J2E5_CERPU|nr:hypothetical protein KC19_2G287300 [Ceratodon purpureus]
MKRQQVISRFFTPKAAVAAAVAPPATPPTASVPNQSFSSAEIPPLAARAPVNGSDFSADFAFGSRGKRSSRKRVQEEVEDSAEEDSQRERGSGGDGSFRAAPLRKKRAIRNTVIPPTVSDSPEVEACEEILDHPRVLSRDVEDQSLSEPQAQGEVHEQLSERGRGSASDVASEEPGPSSSSQPPVVQKRRAWGPYNETVIPAVDPARHRKFVSKLLARNDESATEEELRYGKPPAGKPTYTPLELQVVELKERYPDVLLMVEVGYKYRFFGNDAEIAARVLGIFAYYNHNFLSASIPTFRLHVHVRRLVEAGYKVGVVRQTETAAIKAHGSNKTGPFTRGLSALYTRATLEAAEDLGGDTEGHAGRLHSYLMCIAELPILQGFGSSKSKKSGILKSESDEVNDDNAGYYDTRLGVVAVDTATGDVMFGDFKDTVMRNELEARLLTCTPAELLLASPLSAATEKLVLEYAGPTSEVRIERISRECFRDGGALAEVMAFYKAKGEKGAGVSVKVEENIDPGLEAVMAMPDIVVQALALALRYLRQFGLEKVLQLGASFRSFAGHSEMSLSPNALRQLEILRNNADGTDKGTLLWLMDHTHTPFGARLMRHWVTHPLQDYESIGARLDAVTEIAESMGSVGAAQVDGTFPGSGKGGGYVGLLSRGGIGEGGKGKGLLASLLFSLGKLPDVQRGITRIFLRTATAAEFVSVVQGLVRAARQLRQLYLHKKEDSEMDVDNEHPQGVRSTLLRRLLAAASSVSVSEPAAQLLSALDTDAAASNDRLKLFHCRDGRFPEVTKCRLAIESVEQQLEDLLPAIRKVTKLPRLGYTSVSGTTHLIEAPVAQRVPTNWIKVNSTKAMHRYHSPEVLEALDALTLAKEQLNVACGKAWDAFLADFASHYVDFRAAVQALAALDCLHSLAIVSRSQGYVRPEFADKSDPSQLIITAGRHPVLDATLQEEFVPNDTILQTDKERCQIITGPNMGGKSCYIRQVALIVIMAQVGSYVPAASAKLHVCDAVFTRMGASDSIQKGSSTFFEELSETSAILRRATSRSLVIVDELGRGTSTHDGVAIAYATLHYLLKETRCLTLFVTHYPRLADLKDEFPGKVGPYFVSYLAEGQVNKQSEGPISQYEEEATQRITFLYKLVPGIASRSFGLHVARLAQVPEICVLQAAAMAAKLEDEVSARAAAKASCSKVRTQLVKEEELEENLEDVEMELEAVSDRRLPEVSLDDVKKVLSMVEWASSHEDEVLALSCLKEAQEQAKTLLRLEETS